MCAVSMVMRDWTTPHSPNHILWTSTVPDPDTAGKMLEVLRKLDEIDKKLGMLDCKVEEAQKQKFIRKLKRRAKK